MNDTWKKLCKNNPFSTNAASNPWDNKYPDIYSINSQTFNNVRILLNQKLLNPREPLAALILGEAGSGKTHLLHRILLTIQDEESVSFVNIRPIIDNTAPVRYLLKGIMIDLCRSSGRNKGSSSIYRLLSKIISDWLRVNNKRDAKKFSNDLKDNRFRLDNIDLKRLLKKHRKEIISYIIKKNSSISKEFLKVFLQLGSRRKERILFDWLQGEIIDESDCKRIGVRRRDKKSQIIIEEEAREIIISLGNLMELYHESVLVCFDQLDTLKTQGLIDAFGCIIHTLVNETYSMIPIAFVRADSWNTFYQNKMDPAVYQRLEMNKYSLSGCSRSEALEIIHSRIKYFHVNDSENLYLGFRNELEGVIKEGYSPRQIILLANRKIHSLCSNSKKPLSSLDLLIREFQTEYENVLANFESFPPDTGLLEYSLRFLLKSRMYTSNIFKTENDRVNLHATIKFSNEDPFQVAFIINTSKSHNSVRSCAERGINLINTESGRCIYITESRCTFKKPGWKVTNKKMEEFIKMGGSIWNLEEGEAQRWYALALLILKAENGDLNVESENGFFRMITHVEIDLFVESDFHLPIDPRII